MIVSVLQDNLAQTAFWICNISPQPTRREARISDVIRVFFPQCLRFFLHKAVCFFSCFASFIKQKFSKNWEPSEGNGLNYRWTWTNTMQFLSLLLLSCWNSHHVIQTVRHKTSIFHSHERTLKFHYGPLYVQNSSNFKKSIKTALDKYIPE